MAQTYTFNIDWSNNGVWTNVGEDVTVRVLPDVTITYGRDQARALSPVANGSCGFELDNQSRDYSPENTSSPLNGVILPARPIRIQVADTLMNSNPDFEENTSNWTPFGSSTFTRSTTYARSGYASGRLVSNAASDPRVETGTYAVTVGVTYQYSGYLFSPIALGTQVSVGINWFTSGFAYISTSQSFGTITAGSWLTISDVAVAPATAAYANLRFGFNGTPGAGAILYGDFMRLTSNPLTLFRGHLDEYTVLPAKDERKVTLTGLDPLAKLQEAKCFTALYPSIRTGDAINAILDAISWPANARDIDTGGTTLRWWIVNGDDAWAAIGEILEAEGEPSIITSDGNGNVVFRDRHHRLFTTLNANPTVEGSIAYWTGSGGTVTLETTLSHNGQTCMKFVPDGVTAIVGVGSEYVAASAGTKYTISAWIRCAVSRSISVSVNWSNSSFVYLSTLSVTQSVTANTWTFFYGELTAPANTAYATIVPTMTGTPAGSNIMYVDNIRMQAPSVSAATFRDQTTEPKFSAPLAYDHGWRDVVNSVQFNVEERGPAAEQTVIWSSDAIYDIPAGQTLDIVISAESPYYAATSIDFTVLTGSVGVGWASSGQTTTIQATAGGSDSQVTGFSLLGHAVNTLRTVQISAEDATSITAYGTKSGPDGVGMASLEDAQAVADLTVLTRKVRLPIVQLNMVGSNVTRLTQCLVRNLSDRITVIDAETGLNRDFYIEQITHNITDAGKLHTTTFGCEAVSTASGLDSPADVFIFDHPTNGKFGTGKFGT